MKMRVNCWVSLLLLGLGDVLGLNHKDWLTLRTERAHILSSYKQLVTSSTLSWARIEDIMSGRIPTSCLILVESSIVCRVKDGNHQRAGRTDLSGSCVAGPGLAKHSDYQVLVDPTSLSRHEWLYWDMYTVPQIGTVAYNMNTYVGSFKLASGVDIMGELDFNRGLNGNIKAYVSENHTELSVQGSALVEIEPIKYILDGVELNAVRGKQEEKQTVLGKVSLSPDPGETEDPAEVEARIQFSEPVSLYWGHIPGTIKGLEAESTLFNETVSFVWGMHWSGVQTGERRVEARLQPGTKVHASLRAMVRSGEVPFVGTLTQVYADGKRTRTRVDGILLHTSIPEIWVDYGAPFYVESGLPAPPASVSKSASHTQIPTLHHTQPDSYNDSEGQSDEGSSEDLSISVPDLPPTLYPPTEPTTRRPNPLRRFYPIEEDATDKEEVTPAKFFDEESMASGAFYFKCCYMMIFIFMFKIFIFNV